MYTALANIPSKIYMCVSDKITSEWNYKYFAEIVIFTKQMYGKILTMLTEFNL